METCARFLPSAPCSPYVSVFGTANGKVQGWLASGGLTVQLTSVNGGLQFTAKTPCGPASGPAIIRGTTLTVEKVAVGAVSCANPALLQQQLVLNLLKLPIEVSFNQGILSWKSGADTVRFQAIRSAS